MALSVTNLDINMVDKTNTTNTFYGFIEILYLYPGVLRFKGVMDNTGQC